jgi:tetratricopeptide (TPR) repeat protein
MQGNDWSGATASLDKAKAKDPEAEGLWASYGWMAAFHRKYDEAIADYKKEIAVHPENWGAVEGLANAQAVNGDRAAACDTIQGYLEHHPGDVWMSLYLTGMQSAIGDNEGALKTLEAAARATPDNHMIRARMSGILRLLKRKDEATAAAKGALEGTDDMAAINDAGFVLAEIGLDMPYAEEASRKGIASLEAKTAAITPAEANSSAFAQADLLVHSWGTLGWILFREGKLQEAKPLLVAGWRNSLIPHLGDHLGELYEAMGKKDEALSTYRLAAASIEPNNAQTEVIEHIKRSIARLGWGKTSESEYAGKQALQDTRTYHIARPAGVSGWGTFRLQLSTNGVIASQQMTGEEKLAALAEKINAMKFPELVPPGSAAHLLRSAVVSCSMGTTCDLVLVPNSSLQTEQ